MAKTSKEKKVTKKAEEKPRFAVKTIDQLTLARMVAQKYEMTIASVMDIILEEQKLTMQFLNNGYKVIKKNYITLEVREYKGREWVSPLDKKVYVMDDRKRVIVRVGDGFKHYINGEQKTDDRLCRFVADRDDDNTFQNILKNS